MSQTCAVMAGDAMEKDRLRRGVREQVRGLGHLFHGRGDPSIGTIRHPTPVSATTFACSTYLGSVGIYRRERHDRLDPFATDDPVQGHRILPGSAHQTAGDDHANSLLGVTLGPGRCGYGRSGCHRNSDPHSEANWDRMTHERVISQRPKSPTAPRTDRSLSRILAARRVMAIPTSAARGPVRRQLRIGEFFYIIDESLRVSHWRPVAKTDEFRFQFDELAGRPPILGWVE